MPLNDNNFVTWYSQGESEFTNDLPRPFVREPEIRTPAVWLVPGERYSIWCNTFDGAVMTEPLEIVNQVTGAAYTLDTGNVQSVTWGTGGHRIATFQIPNLPEGYYKLRLGTRTSQTLWLTDLATAQRFSAVVMFRDPGRVFDFRYGHAPQDFYQTLRVRMTMTGEEPDDQKEVYTGSTTGKTRHLYSAPKMVVGVQTPQYVRAAHRGFKAMMEHDTIFINGKPYAYHEAYKTNMVIDSVYSTGSCSFSDETYATLHRS